MTGPRVRKQAEAHNEARGQAIAKADALLQALRTQVSRAVLASLRGNEVAAVETRAALGLVEEARAELAKLNETTS